ncbi:orexin receptor type 2-like [Tachypleus tridentatus]|uniref:orexin receptor type 2-like n=1 Tax=Tachypleus tridentatus TaxID=6853 RepID=UPI003FD1D1FD
MDKNEVEIITWPELYDSNVTNNNNETNTTELCTNSYCIPDEDYIELIEEYIFPTRYEWTLIFFHFCVFVVGLMGNALVCISVYRNNTMQTVTNYFIVNLAVADFLVILICLPPSVLWDVTETWFFGAIMCKLVLYLQSVSVSVSVLTLTFISVDRWYAICYPLEFKSSTTNTKVIIIFIWTISFLLVLPEAIVLDIQKHPNIKVETYYLTDCSYTWDGRYTRIYQMYIFIALYILPFILMSVVYCQIARVLWNRDIPGSSETTLHHHARRGRTGELETDVVNPNCEGQIRSRRKAAKMLISVVILFGLCYLPVHLINTLRYTVGIPQSDATSVASLLSHWLCYANSAANPIVYNFMSGKFRKEFKNSFACLCFRRTHRGRSRKTTNIYKSRFASSTTHFENINLNSFIHYS